MFGEGDGDERFELLRREIDSIMLGEADVPYDKVGAYINIFLIMEGWGGREAFVIILYVYVCVEDFRL